MLSDFKIRIWKELPTQRKTFLMKLTFLSCHSDFSSHVTFSKVTPATLANVDLSPMKTINLYYISRFVVIIVTLIRTWTCLLTYSWSLPPRMEAPIGQGPHLSAVPYQQPPQQGPAHSESTTGAE